MNEEQIALLIKLLETIERRQLDDSEELKRLREGILKQEKSSPHPIRINWSPVLEQIDQLKGLIQQQGRLPLVENIPSKSRYNIGHGMVVFCVAVFLCLIINTLYWRPQLDDKVRAETISRTVEYYTLNNKRDHVSIDSISKRIRPGVFRGVIESLKEEKENPIQVSK